MFDITDSRRSLCRYRRRFLLRSLPPVDINKYSYWMRLSKSLIHWSMSLTVAGHSLRILSFSLPVTVVDHGRLSLSLAVCGHCLWKLSLDAIVNSHNSWSLHGRRHWLSQVFVSARGHLLLDKLMITVRLLSFAVPFTAWYRWSLSLVDISDCLQ